MTCKAVIAWTALMLAPVSAVFAGDASNAQVRDSIAEFYKPTFEGDCTANKNPACKKVLDEWAKDKFNVGQLLTIGRIYMAKGDMQDYENATLFVKRAQSLGATSAQGLLDTIDALANNKPMPKGQAAEPEKAPAKAADKPADKAKEAAKPADKAATKPAAQAKGKPATASAALNIPELDAAPSEDSIASMQKKADKGDRDAAYVLGLVYYNGRGVDRDLRRSASWFRKAADKGNGKAMYCLGLMTRAGQGAIADPEEGFNLIKKAAAAGVSDAQRELARAYLSGEGVAKDQKAGLGYLENAAKGGDAKSQEMLGKVYSAETMNFADLDYGVQDLSKAYLWLNVAASNGLASAATTRDELEGNMDPDSVVSSQRATSEYCAQKGAVCNKPGLPADITKGALAWSDVSQFKLGEAYNQGKEVYKDYTTAYMWFLLASTNEQEGAKAMLEKVVGVDLQRAHKMAKDWEKSHPLK